MTVPDRKTEAAIRQLQSRHGRRKSEYCLCEGVRACRELLSKAPGLIVSGVLRDDIAAPEGTDHFFRASEKWFNEFSPTVQSQGILILAKRPAEIPDTVPAADAFVVALDHVCDPGNLGTIMRTAAASGRREIWLTKGSADPFSDKSIRAAIAIQFSLNIRFFENLTEMLQRAPRLGMTGKMMLTTPHRGENIFTAPTVFNRSILVFGGEANGISEVPEGAEWVTLPMPGGEESLNVAQAATVFLFEYVRRNTKG